MPHIHTQPGQHDHTVTGYIVRVDGSEPQVMLHMHKKLGILLPIGGHIELNEDPWQAMCHELKEESGYDISQLKILQPPDMLQKLTDATIHPYPLVLNTHSITPEHSHSDIAFGFVASGPPAHAVHDGESSDIRWYTHAQLMALSENTLPTNIREVYDFMCSRALPAWKQVALDAEL